MAATPAFFGMSFHPEARTCHAFGRDGMATELADAGVFSWIDLHGSDIQAANEVLGSMGVDLVLTSHFDAPEVLPRLLEGPSCLAFYLYEVEDPERHLDTAHGITEFRFHRLLLVLGEAFVLTFHRHSLAAVAEIQATCEESFKLAGRTPGFIAFLFLQRCLYDYAHLNLANDNYLDVLEEGLISRDHSRAYEGIGVAGQNILTLKKLASSLHIVLMRLATKRSPFISTESVSFYREMLQNAATVRASIDSSRDLLDGILGAVQAQEAQRTSEVARVLTVISGVLLPLTVITGVYGMNFENMPETKWRLGYFGVLGIMAVVALGLLLAFHRLGWIGASKGRSDT